MSRHDILARESSEYKAIKMFYGDRKAQRSRVLLIQHINDGLVVMEEIGASLHARKAFCLHPMFQANDDLGKTVLTNGPFWKLDCHVVLLVMEYRNQANAFLSEKVNTGYFNDPRIIGWNGAPTPGPLSEVRDMLIADKVQNYKDFLKYHKADHPRSEELTTYFQLWFKALDVDPDQYVKLAKAIDAA